MRSLIAPAQPSAPRDLTEPSRFKMCVAIESLLRINGSEVFGGDFFNTIGGGFNRSVQHLLILLDQEVSAWNGQPG
jgi:hypothetical protein